MTLFFFFQAEDGIRDKLVTGVQTCALPISFDAASLEVIVATDHDVIHDYTQTVNLLGLGQRMNTVVGIETTGHIPTLTVPNYGFPIVIGHYNFWPLLYDPTKPRNGGPFDEALQPGELFER